MAQRAAAGVLVMSWTPAGLLPAAPGALIIRDFCAVSMGRVTVLLGHLTEKVSPLIRAVKISLANSSSRG